MKAVRVHEFGGVDVLSYEDVPRPSHGVGQVLVRVAAAGVGPWDALIRAGGSQLVQTLPVTLGSDLSGVVEEVGPDVPGFQPGDEVFGVTNSQFLGAYAEYAVVEAGKIARKPRRLSHVEAAAVPVVACTAWQMLFDHAHIDATKRVLVQGAAGSVGAFAVQLAKETGATVIGTARAEGVEYVRRLGADQVIDVSAARFQTQLPPVDVVLDLVGGETQERSFDVLTPGGVLVSAVSLPNQEKARQRGVRAVFFYVDVTTPVLTEIAERLESGRLQVLVGETLPLADARRAHEMLAGAPHAPGKIVLLPNTRRSL